MYLSLNLSIYVSIHLSIYLSIFYLLFLCHMYSAISIFNLSSHLKTINTNLIPFRAESLDRASRSVFELAELSPKGKEINFQKLRRYLEKQGNKASTVDHFLPFVLFFSFYLSFFLSFFLFLFISLLFSFFLSFFFFYLFLYPLFCILYRPVSHPTNFFAGRYPAQYRPLIWRFLLQLPENSREFSDLGE